MKTIALAASFAGLAIADKPDYQKLWDQYKADYNKYFPGNGNEEQKRFQIFKDNVDTIEAHNAKKLSYTLGINEYADQTAEEFFKTHLGYNPGQKPFEGLPKVPFTNVTDVADSIDWVSKGAVTPVKNQQRCGSCWAFSTTGSTEGAYFISSGKLLSLSEQDLVSCDHNGDQGCQGGLMDHAFGWIKQNGICTEEDYPYTSGGGQTGTCAKTCKAAVTVTGYTDVPAKDEDALKQAVSKQPVSVAIEADKSAFQLYKSGVLDNAACGTQLDHGVLVVGYGTDGGKDYWKVKNSWGATWGEEGYLRMIRNKNQCGISQQPSYPTGAKAAGQARITASGKHYEDPKDGCSSDEVDIKIQGVSGAVCAPACTGTTCPTDVPSGVTAHPQCALQDASSGKKYCALICSPSANDAQCGSNASCKSISGVGICTYDDATDLMHTSAKYEPTSEAVVV